MSVLAMEVLGVEEHPNADTLRVYTFGADNVQCTVVANDENIYAMGDVVAVAQVGAVLKDGTKIGKRRIRGINSRGMALGAVDAAVGTNLTQAYCLSSGPSALHMPWPSILGLSGVFKEVEARNAEPGLDAVRTVAYRAKTKLHGTNAGVQVHPDGTVVAQSRSRVLSLEDDNSGFAKWVATRAEGFKSLAAETVVTVFGEWCGPGIQAGTAVNQLEQKLFAVFAMQHGDDRQVPATVLIEPEQLSDTLAGLTGSDLRVLPWASEPLLVTYTARAQSSGVVEQINTLVEETEACDPFVKAISGVDGVGEGVVLYPTHVNGVHLGVPLRESLSFLLVKAKGEKHRVKKAKLAASLAPEVAANVGAFVEMFATAARFEQGLSEVGPVTHRNTGAFLKWVALDIKKESVHELEVAGLSWKHVAKPVTEAAKTFWFARL